MANSDVTLSGTATDVWIFQISNDLTVASGFRFILEGEAQAKKYILAGFRSGHQGNYLPHGGHHPGCYGHYVPDWCSLKGRALSQTQVVLDGNAITHPQ